MKYFQFSFEKLIVKSKIVQFLYKLFVNFHLYNYLKGLYQY